MIGRLLLQLQSRLLSVGGNIHNKPWASAAAEHSRSFSAVPEPVDSTGLSSACLYITCYEQFTCILYLHVYFMHYRQICSLAVQEGTLWIIQGSGSQIQTSAHVLLQRL